MIPVDASHRGLGGSDVCAILGYSAYRTAFDVWSEATGRTPRYSQPPSESAEWGTRLEASVAAKYAETNRRTLYGDGATRYRHETWEWITGRPDRLSFDDPSESDARVLEIKTTAAHKRSEWGDPGSSEVPDRVACQAEWYMLLSGLDTCDVVVLFGGQEYAQFTLHGDEQVQSFLLAEAGRFWVDHVLTDVPPPIDSSVGARDYLGERLRASTNRVVAAPDSLRETFDRYRAAQVAKSNAEAECDVLRAQLASQVVAADAKGFSFADATFKAVEMSGRIDYKKLSEELMQRAKIDDATKLELSSKYVGKPAVQWRTFAKKEW